MVAIVFLVSDLVIKKTCTSAHSLFTHIIIFSCDSSTMHKIIQKQVNNNNKKERRKKKSSSSIVLSELFLFSKQSGVYCVLVSEKPQTSYSNPNSHVKVIEIFENTLILVLMSVFTETIGLYLLDSMHCTPATFYNCMIKQVY